MSRSVAFVVGAGGLLPAGVAEWTALVPLDGALGALQRLARSGYAIVVLGDIVAAGGRLDPAAADAFVTRLLRSQGVAAEFSRCPHPADAGCDCALPGLGLVRSHIADPALDRNRSIVVGGDDVATALGANMGLRSFVLGPTEDAAGTTRWDSVVHRVLDAPRTAVVERRTRETSIDVAVDLDREAPPAVGTGIGFFDHMLEQLGKHGGFALSVSCQGDLEVDEHHTVEDVAIAIGEALRRALGTKAGIGRYGFVLPMDEACAQVSIDLSGRPYFVFDGQFAREAVGGLPTELVPHFFRSVSDALGATVHLQLLGDNDHHKIEASFKGFARALRQAISREGDELPSTKGVL